MRHIKPVGRVMVNNITKIKGVYNKKFVITVNNSSKLIIAKNSWHMDNLKKIIKQMS